MSQKTAKNKIRTSFTLTKTAKDMLNALAEKQGISMTAILEIIIREKYDKELYGQTKN